MTVRAGKQVLSVAAFATILASSLEPALAQAPQPVRVRGIVVSVQGSELVVKPRTGENVTVRLADNWAVSGVVKASMADIKPGTFVGTAALPQAGDSLRAIEIVIFPETMRGTGEGHYPWDLQTNSSMTNATVASEVQGVDGRTLTLSYKGGEKTVVLPADAPVVTFAPAEKSDLKVGAPVFVPTQRQPDGSLEAARPRGQGRCRPADVIPCQAARFHVPARSGRTDADVLAESIDAVESWIGRVVSNDDQ